MSEINGIQQTNNNQAVSSATSSSSSAAAAGSGDFDKVLRSFITPDAENNISEEDLFAALVKERLEKLKGGDFLSKYNEAYTNAQNEVRKPDGFVSPEDATKKALISLKDGGELTGEETNKIYSEAFAGAQLDNNTEALFDSRGGPNDPTKAVASLETALLGARVKIESLGSGTEELKMRDVTEASFGHNGAKVGTAAASGAGAGFLWKPISDSDGKLAILMPPSLAGQIQSLSLKTASGDLIEEGKFGGNGNGGRDHYRFSKAGGSYPSGVVVEAMLKSGQLVKYTIDNPSDRVEDPTSSSGEDNSSSGNDSSSSEVSSTVDSSVNKQKESSSSSSSSPEL